jgi:hypothetical protein
MKEVTTAQGQLRCGECDYTFDAMNSLSSTLPNDIRTSKDSIILKKKQQQGNDVLEKNKFPKYVFFVSLLLALLLLMQAMHSYRNWLAHQPLTAGITRTFCDITHCEITPQRDPQNISIISHNVYAHPNETDALIISASLKNKASYLQPLPLVEVSFLNKKGETIALRRFRPESYLKKRKDKLFKSKETITFKLKIEDPGAEAVRFKFRFL